MKWGFTFAGKKSCPAHQRLSMFHVKQKGSQMALMAEALIFTLAKASSS
jgi:hypothetical protein